MHFMRSALIECIGLQKASPVPLDHRTPEGYPPVFFQTWAADETGNLKVEFVAEVRRCHRSNPLEANVWESQYQDLGRGKVQHVG